MHAPTVETILMTLGSGVAGIVVAMVVFFAKSYFKNKDKKVDDADNERKGVIKKLNEVKLEITKMNGDSHTAYAKLAGKIDALHCRIESYSSNTSRLEGKIEACTEITREHVTLLDQVSKQLKRLFSIVSPLQADVRDLKAGLSPS